ncbi:GNAT family N-acetyltransferase [Planococcus shenhongbingii]|uniref:GNAT family N-acetyltransferase n=1 Tax=Planococcus shenhongbingii TaxID=3058398 RepID=A0ABT8N7M9_9BACL|nr:GNAT family N-acetyltransferase [Planococcus sp. N017]MDN7243881.1 GNAT family N-acetyltransferase [Planococcus sp. N017]
MNNSLVIKEYGKEHQIQVVDLILQIQQKEYNIPITKDDQPDLFAIEDFYQTGNGNFWIAVYNKKVVGTISFLDIGGNQVALRKMFVDKEFRGSTFKTASLLLDRAIEWAEEKSVKAIILGTTPQFLAAHRFYEKNGFASISPNELPESFPVLQVDKRFYKLDVNVT